MDSYLALGFLMIVLAIGAFTIIDSPVAAVLMVLAGVAFLVAGANGRAKTRRGKA